MVEIKLVVDYEAYENGTTMTEKIDALAQGPQSSTLESLIIGDWGGSYENDSSEIVDVLVKSKESFPRLHKLFIGDMSFEECEVSWIMQTDLTPLLVAYPQLTSLKVKGSTGLKFGEIRHDYLEELVIICGGLGRDVLGAIANAQLPRLKKLELYLGVDNYGFDGTLEDVMAVARPGLFPQLLYLGLKDSELQDEIAIAIADSPVLDQLHTLDLSQGTLTDEGAEALINSARVRQLKFLDLSYHYMSDKMVQQWRQTGLAVDLSDQQSAEDDDYRYPSLTE